jgi:hypothetical protein
MTVDHHVVTQPEFCETQPVMFWHQRGDALVPRIRHGHQVAANDPHMLPISDEKLLQAPDSLVSSWPEGFTLSAHDAPIELGTWAQRHGHWMLLASGVLTVGLVALSAWVMERASATLAPSPAANVLKHRTNAASPHSSSVFAPQKAGGGAAQSRV